MTSLILGRNEIRYRCRLCGRMVEVKALTWCFGPGAGWKCTDDCEGSGYWAALSMDLARA